MRSTIALGLLVAVLTGANALAKPARTIWRVQGVSTTQDEAAIEAAVRALPGVTRAYTTRTFVSVSFDDSRMTPAMLRAAIGEAGAFRVLGVGMPVMSEATAALGPPKGIVSFGLFYTALEPYGAWFSDNELGWVWSPTGVAAAWRPYSVGHWTYTEWGWTWVENDRFGWATFHYGRWQKSDTRGWTWIPGNEWSPGWVAWRHGGGYLGWAALTPKGSTSVAVHDVRAIERGIHPDAWIFVPAAEFASGKALAELLPADCNPSLLAKSRSASRFDVGHGRRINEGLELFVVQREARSYLSRHAAHVCAPLTDLTRNPKSWATSAPPAAGATTPDDAPATCSADGSNCRR